MKLFIQRLYDNARWFHKFCKTSHHALIAEFQIVTKQLMANYFINSTDQWKMVLEHKNHTIR